MTVRGVLIGALAGLFLPSAAAAQSGAPQLNRSEREALRAVVAAVDAAADWPASEEIDWPLHLLRASDGSHYVAFSALVPPEMAVAGPATLYVRLATRSPQVTSLAERSAVMEWLVGQRSDPLPQRPARVVSVPTGEMPVAGLAGAPDRTGSGQNSAALRLIEHERERARERREDAERSRRAALESDTAADRAVYPFEDFDVRAVLEAAADGRVAVRRAFTSGPGEFDLYVGWLPAGAPPATPVHVVKRPLHLPPASSREFGLSTVIVADEVAALPQPYPADQQTAHPYAIGTMGVTPAVDTDFTQAEQLTVVVQVVNPQASSTGKPDVMVGFRVLRVTDAGETLAATLNPQHYHIDTLPASFDLTLGHPLFVAMAAPLDSLSRGRYRLHVAATDRLAGVSTTASVAFRIVATAASLLREAPAPVAPPFERTTLLAPDVLDALIDEMAPTAPSEAMARAIKAAREQRFFDLLREEPVLETEAGARGTLRGLALYALGDTPHAVAIQLELALRQSAPAGPTHVLLGACRALAGDHRAAAAAWQAALDAGAAPVALARELAHAYLRAGAGALAVPVIRDRLEEAPGDRDWLRLLGAAQLVAGNESEALAALEAADVEVTGDIETRFLLLRALFAGFVHDRGAGATDEGRERFSALARDYIAADGPHAALVNAWLDMISASL